MAIILIIMIELGIIIGLLNIFIISLIIELIIRKRISVNLY
jgi:hypothetical protein